MSNAAMFKLPVLDLMEMFEWVSKNDLLDRGLTFEEREAAYSLATATKNGFLIGEYKEMAEVVLVELKAGLGRDEALVGQVEGHGKTLEHVHDAGDTMH